LQLASDLVQHWLANNPRASICTQEGVRDFKAIANFQDYHGLPQFRKVSNEQRQTENLIIIQIKHAI